MIGNLNPFRRLYSTTWVNLNFNYKGKYVLFDQITLEQQEAFEVLIQI